jgi:predicted secreted Zn-dependent protease
MGRSGPGGKDASTHWRVTWHYTYSGFGSCRINSLDVSIDIRFTFPRWVNPVGAPLDLVHDWNRFILALVRHEAGHVRLAEQAGNKILRSLPGFEAPCDEFVAAADAVADSIIDRLREKQRLYDERTDHGATQGARLI